METPILATKLFIPQPRPRIVTRQRLMDRITEGFHRKLTLVSAPAGFGKTTLVSEWASGCGNPAAWYSLDDGDTDPSHFLRYFISAIQMVSPGVGQGILGLLDSPQPPPVDSLLLALINEISRLDRKIVLILDDYHLINTEPVNEILKFFLEHQPPSIHLIITTREDPAFPLARLRAGDQLTEFRAADLGFTLSEAEEFLNHVMELKLPAEDISLLETRTEGWIAGLQLAAISLRGQKDPADFIRGFSGSHHFVLDYLIAEVVRQQPDTVRTFLLSTSILDRMCGSLCDALLEAHAGTGQEILLSLEQSNLFIIPLDNERKWYRYHHLFADLLRQQLRQNPPALASLPMEMTESEIEAELHIRASQWYEGNGLEIEAFQHAAAAGDLDLTERLIDSRGMPLHFKGASAPVLRWLDSLPFSVMNSRPSLWVTYGSATMISGHPSQVEPKLKAAEFALRGAEDNEKNRDLIGQIAAMRALVAASRNDIDGIITQSNRALEYLHPQNVSVRTITTFSLGVVYELQNDREAATREFNEVITTAQASGNFMFTLAALSSLAGLQLSNNKLRDAEKSFKQSIEIINDPDHWISYDPHFGLARIYYEWNDLAAAEDHARRCIRLAPQVECGTAVSAEVLLTRICLARGDIAGAAAQVVKAYQTARERILTDKSSEVDAVQVDVWLRQGKIQEAETLAVETGLPICQVRVLLAAGKTDEALAILEKLLWKLMEMDRQDERLKAIILLAAVFFIRGDTGKAIRQLDTIFPLTEPEGYLRLFLDEGEPIRGLLKEAAVRGIEPDYTARLLAVIDEQPDTADAKIAGLSNQLLVDPLSPRELEVLQLIADGLSNREIGEKLFLALSTVKGHSQVIFDKLQVQRRTEAVARARELGLI
jgi:LuxR family transcriptional regulator, maltose regulon positive regulatory protein